MKYLIIVLLFVSTGMHAQKCRYLANKVSGMDGTRLIITEPLLLSSNFDDGNIEVWSTIYGDTALIVAFVIEINKDVHLNKGDSILTRLENDEIVGLKLIQNSAIKENEEGKVLTVLTEADKRDIELYQTSKVSEIIVSAGDMEMKGSTIKKDQSIAIRTIINCVVRYLE